MFNKDDVESLRLAIRRGLVSQLNENSHILGSAVQRNAIECTKLLLGSGIPTPGTARLIEISTLIGKGSAEFVKAFYGAGVQLKDQVFSAASITRNSEVLEALTTCPIPFNGTYSTQTNFASFRIVLSERYTESWTLQNILRHQTEGRHRTAAWLALGLRDKSAAANQMVDPYIRSTIDAYFGSADADAEDQRIHSAFQSSTLGSDEKGRAIERALVGAAVRDDAPINVLIRLKGSPGWAEFLLAHGLPINYRDRLGRTLTDIAISRGNSDAARVYNSAGAPYTGYVFAEDDSSPVAETDTLTLYERPERAFDTPIAEVVGVRPDSRQIALSHRPELAYDTAIDGTTPLMIAHGITKQLIDLGADVHAVDRMGRTAMHHWASRTGGESAIEVLLGAGADPTACDHGGRRPLDLAVTPQIAAVIFAAIRQKLIFESLPGCPATPRKTRNDVF